MKILHRVAQMRAAGRDVISLCAGEPSGGAPRGVSAKAAEVHASGMPLTYTSALGISELREVVARHYRRWYKLELGPDEVAITTGSSGAFMLTFLAAFNPGDRVALARPGYPAYRNILGSLGCEVVEIDCGPAERYQPTPALLDAAAVHGPLAGLILASPANPTGTMVSRAELAALSQWCAANGVRLVSDEIYHGITYPADPQTPDARGVCAWELDRTGVVVSSF
ncbi:MAG TPA: aminotransferase class I/II-fold pyridoxal phosphate-dependent enzyme, partial [Arthrobacter sp.]|nr:aminotransferase class I/II-fold pyridoxal phosphate-dependent enzyme [Arthrobacter sp.]